MEETCVFVCVCVCVRLEVCRSIDLHTSFRFQFCLLLVV